MANIKRKTLQKTIKQVSNGLLATTVDVILYSLFLCYKSIGKSRRPSHVYQTFREADELIKEINYKKFSNALMMLKRKRLITPTKRGLFEPKITKLGRERLAELIPTYKTKRPWDGFIYLINYDISVVQNQRRDLFRSFLHRLSAVRLQDSLYLICYNPSDLIKEFVNQHRIKGDVLVSSLNKEGSIGEKDLKTLLTDIYQLDKLNQHYQKFIRKFSHPKRSCPKTAVAFEFLSILNDDPQLPFELLLPGFASNQAYQLFKKLTW